MWPVSTPANTLIKKKKCLFCFDEGAQVSLCSSCALSMAKYQDPVLWTLVMSKIYITLETYERQKM